MKNFITLTGCFLFCLPLWAAPAVQRTLNSSYAEYKKYLQNSGGTTFVEAYIHLSSVVEMEAPLLEKCLEEVYLGAPSANTCLAAVKSLTSKPLNQPRREVLFSFLTKLSKIQSTQKDFYLLLRTGLLRTHASLAKTFQVEVPANDNKTTTIQELEMKAWKKAVLKKFPLEEIALLINGKKVSNLEKWSAPYGIYQWSLISNTHEPFIRLGTFSQFAAESLKGLNPLASSSCEELPKIEAQKFGMLQLEVFSKAQCVARFGMETSIARKEEHLGNSATMVQMEKSNFRHWIWPVIAVVGVGLATSLKDKQVSVSMPSFQ